MIGVVADVRETSAEDNAGWQMYLPATKQFGPEGLNLVVRSKLPPLRWHRAVMTTLRQINPGQPATEFKPIQNLVDHATSPRRFFLLLVATFAGLGLLFASWEFTESSPIPLRARRRRSASAWPLGATQERVLRWRDLEDFAAGIRSASLWGQSASYR